jgi:hypothetical protein
VPRSLAGGGGGTKSWKPWRPARLEVVWEPFSGVDQPPEDDEGGQEHGEREHDAEKAAVGESLAGHRSFQTRIAASSMTALARIRMVPSRSGPVRKFSDLRFSAAPIIPQLAIG